MKRLLATTMPVTQARSRCFLADDDVAWILLELNYGEDGLVVRKRSYSADSCRRAQTCVGSSDALQRLGALCLLQFLPGMLWPVQSNVQ